MLECRIWIAHFIILLYPGRAPDVSRMFHKRTQESTVPVIEKPFNDIINVISPTESGTRHVSVKCALSIELMFGVIPRSLRRISQACQC